MNEKIKLVCIKSEGQLIVGDIYTGRKLSRISSGGVCSDIYETGYFITKTCYEYGSWYSTNILIPLAEYRDNQINNILE